MYAVGGSIFAQLCVVYVPPLQAIFQTEALTLNDWLFIVCITAPVLLLDELFKALQRDRMQAANFALHSVHVGSEHGHGDTSSEYATLLQPKRN